MSDLELDLEMEKNKIKEFDEQIKNKKVRNRDSISNFLDIADPTTNSNTNIEEEQDNIEDDNTELALLDENIKEDIADVMANKYNESLDYVNNNMREILNSGISNMQEAMSLLSDAQDPRMYQAISMYIKTLVDANKIYLENNKPISLKGNIDKNNKQNDENKNTNNNVTPFNQNVQINTNSINMVSPTSLLE